MNISFDVGPFFGTDQCCGSPRLGFSTTTHDFNTAKREGGKVQSSYVLPELPMHTAEAIAEFGDLQDVQSLMPRLKGDLHTWQHLATPTTTTETLPAVPPHKQQATTDSTPQCMKCKGTKVFTFTFGSLKGSTGSCKSCAGKGWQTQEEIAAHRQWVAGNVARIRNSSVSPREELVNA